MVGGEVLAYEDFYILGKAIRRHSPLSQIMNIKFGEATEEYCFLHFASSTKFIFVLNPTADALSFGEDLF
jgi:hypothetical protein